MHPLTRIQQQCEIVGRELKLLQELVNTYKEPRADMPLPKYGPLSESEVLNLIGAKGIDLRGFITQININRPVDKIREEFILDMLEQLEAESKVRVVRMGGGVEKYFLPTRKI